MCLNLFLGCSAWSNSKDKRMSGVIISAGGSYSVLVHEGVRVSSVEAIVVSVGVCSSEVGSSLMLCISFFRCFFIAANHILSFVKEGNKM